MNRAEYEKRVSSSLNHFYEKLFLLKDMMSTDYGRKIAAFGDFLKVEDAFCIADGRAAEFKDSHRDVVRFMMMAKIEN